MSKFTIRLLIALLTFCVGVASAAGWFFLRTRQAQALASQPVVQSNNTDMKSQPTPRWGVIFYRYIDNHTRLVGLPPLRSSALPQGDLEVRVWYGFGLTALEGFILKRAAGQWSALYLEGDSYYEPKKVKRKEIGPPQSGWEACWERLAGAGIRTLPDSSEIDYDAGGPDGWGYLVEIREGNSYRTFHYQVPEYSRRTEARRVLEIGNTIGNEFKLPSFKEKKISGR
jgi:hypothetical protein